MSPVWKRFFLIRVALVVMVIFAAGQLAAMALNRVTLRRSYMDDLAIAVTQDHTPYRVVLLGDSITLMATRRFLLGRGSHDVANLATIAWTGAAAELFLLERYLETHPAPQYVVYASAIDDLHTNDRVEVTHYYDWNVYTRPGERAFLREYVPGIDARENWPAILNVQENIVERLESLVRRGLPSMPMGTRVPDNSVQTEPADENRVSADILHRRQLDTPVLGSLHRAVLTQMCKLSLRYGFQLSLVWPPLPAKLAHDWTNEGVTAKMDAQIRSVYERGCNAAPIFDINSLRSYTNFNRDGFHLHGEGWEERYAADLSRYIAALPNRAPASLTQSTATAAKSASHETE